MTEPTYHSEDYSDLTPPHAAAADPMADLDQYVRRNPTGSILWALGLGLAVGVLVRGLRREPEPQDRLAKLLEDLEDRFRETSTPALRKAAELVSDSAHVLGDGLHRGEAHVERIFRRAARRVRGFWS